MEKSIFISHSSKDKDYAIELCNYIEGNKYGCWIAPRDIPYGNEWAGEITKAIRESKVFIFIFSANSNVSPQVNREIKIAMDYSVPIIFISLDDSKMNDVLAYYLATPQGIFESDTDYKESLLSRIDSVLNNNDNNSNNSSINIDNAIGEHLTEFFGTDGSASPSKTISPVENVIRKKISNNYIDKFIDNLSKLETTKSNHLENKEYIKSSGKNFTIIDNPNEKTLCFRVNSIIDIETRKIKKCFLEELDCIREPIENDNTSVTFYIDFSEYYYSIPFSTRLILLTFNINEKIMLINNGVLCNDKVFITREPSVERWESKTNSILKNQSIYNIINDNAKQSVAGANTESDILIIDLDELQVVKRNLLKKPVFDNWEANINLAKGHKYFVCKCVLENDLKATDIAVAFGYLFGCFGIERNVIKATELLMTDNSENAKYILSHIFKYDDLLHDEEEYHRLLKESADMGCIDAQIELDDSNAYKDTEPQIFVTEDEETDCRLIGGFPEFE